MLPLLAAAVLLAQVAPTSGLPPREVAVGAFERPPLLRSATATGDDHGLFLDLLEQIAAREGWRLTTRSCAPHACLDQLRSGALDILPAVAAGADRRLVLSDEPVISTWAQVWVATGRRVDSLLELDRLTVGVVAGDASAAEARTLAGQLGLDPTFVELRSTHEVLDALDRGWVEAGVVDRLDALTEAGRPGLAQTPLILSPVALHYGFAPGADPGLRAAVDYHLRALKRDPTSRYYQLLNRVLGAQPASPLPATVRWALVGGVGLLAVALAGALVLRRQVSRATAALARRNRALEQEVAKRLEAEVQLRRSTVLLERAFAAIRDGLLVLEPDSGRLLDSNPAACTILGYTRNELLALPATDLLPAGDGDELLRRAREEVGRRGFLEQDRPLRRRSGNVFPAHLVVTQATSGVAADALWVVSLRDLTAQEEAERALREAQKLEAFGQLAGGIAHDFNNLLQALMNTVALLRRELASSAPVDEAIDAISSQLTHGARLTRQLLLFARKEVSRFEPLDLAVVVRQAGTWLRRLVRENVRMEVQTGEAPLPVEADRGQLEQVLANLVVNAVNAMPDGGELRLATGEERDVVWLEVADTGVGMTPEVQARVFEPFFTTRPAGEGSGLGLAVAHGIATRHRGRITVDSAPGRGSRFRLLLPRGQALVATDAATAPALPLPARNARVLLVEDDDVAREGLRELLGLLGYQVAAAANAEEAVVLAEREDPFTALVTDLTLPGVDGLDLAGHLLVRWPALRAVVMSGYPATGGVQAAVSQGRLRFLQKPFAVDALSRELADALAGPTPGGRPATR